jgi:hypothetical protein
MFLCHAFFLVEKGKSLVRGSLLRGGSVPCRKRTTRNSSCIQFVERRLVAIEKYFNPVPIGFGAKLKLCLDFYTVQGERPVVCFIDPRLHGGLTALGRQFAFSAMYHNLALGDFSEATFEILRFPRFAIANERYVRVHQFGPSELVSEDEINEAIDKTYKIWIEVLADREEEARRHPPTGTGGMFG